MLNVRPRNHPSAQMSVEFKAAPPDFAAEYIRLRGMTRENAVSEERLRALGITAET